jgi:hypothetical protein
MSKREYKMRPSYMTAQHMTEPFECRYRELVEHGQAGQWKVWNCDGESWPMSNEAFRSLFEVD